MLNSKFLTLGYLLSIFPFIALLFVVLFDISVNPRALIPLIGGFMLCLITQAIFARLLPNYSNGRPENKRSDRRLSPLSENGRREPAQYDEPSGKDHRPF